MTDELTKGKVLAALRGRHAYPTEDPNLRVIVRIGGHLGGDIVPPHPLNAEIPIDISINNDDEPMAEYKVDVFSDKAVGGEVARVVDTVTVRGNNSAPVNIEDIRSTGSGQYVFLRVRQLDEQGDMSRAWTAPVWFTTATVAPLAAAPTTTGATPATGTEMASRTSAVYHLNEECIDAKHIKPENQVRGEDAKRGRRLHSGCPRRQE